jgi:hypothetical protein
MPSAAWTGIALVIGLSLALAGLWAGRTSPQSVTNAPGTPTPEIDLALFLEDAEALDTEALAWSDTEIFIALNELEASEEETLRELIALAFPEDNGV